MAPISSPVCPVNWMAVLTEKTCGSVERGAVLLEFIGRSWTIRAPVCSMKGAVPHFHMFATINYAKMRNRPLHGWHRPATGADALVLMAYPLHAWRCDRHALPERKKHGYFFCSSMPLVALPGLVAQQKT